MYTLAGVSSKVAKKFSRLNRYTNTPEISRRNWPWKTLVLLSLLLALISSVRASMNSSMMAGGIRGIPKWLR